MKIVKVGYLLAAFTILSNPISYGASIFFDNSTYKIQDASGNQLVNTGDNRAAYGWFVDGFTPTLANYSSWLNNFSGVTGYHQYQSATSNLISAGITIAPVAGPDHFPDDGLYDYRATVGGSQAGPLVGLAALGGSLPENKSFSVIIWNDAVIANATQAAIISSAASAWRITTQFDVETPDIVEVGGQAGGLSFTFGSGSNTSGSRFIQLGVVPEPSTGALMMIGAAGLVALRRLRKV